MFRVAKGTVCVILHEVCNAIVQVLMKKYINFPTGQQLKETIDGFERLHGFPQCVGAVDGTHIEILAPEEYAKDYYNRKGYYSILMQAVADHRYCFTDINIGWPGSVHDARVFKNSQLYLRASQGTLIPANCYKVMNGVRVPLIILGDSAYPLSKWLMKPYSDNGHLSSSTKDFNYRLSRARIVIENAFGRLKGRWRCLLKQNDTDLYYLPNVIAACATLHNMCEIHKEHFNEEWYTSSGHTSADSGIPSSTESSATDATAETIRSALKNYVLSHPL